jgi:hypothetical protein
MSAQVDAWQAQGDHRAAFLGCYMQMTGNMMAALDAGEYNDPEWVRPLLERFADYYFDALAQYEQERVQAPAVWQMAHDTARRPDSFVLHNLLLGVNAHINYDLVLTLVDMLQDEWPYHSEQRRAQRHADYCHVNDIIGRTVDAVQDTIIERAEPEMDLLDRALGPLDEWMIGHLIGRWRENVWQQAAQLIETADVEERELIRRAVEAETIHRAEALLMKQGLSGLADLF